MYDLNLNSFGPKNPVSLVYTYFRFVCLWKYKRKALLFILSVFSSNCGNELFRICSIKNINKYIKIETVTYEILL